MHVRSQVRLPTQEYHGQYESGQLAMHLEGTVISEVDKPSDELKTMLLLNSQKLRSHPANHTIHALEYITFDKFVFVVMPRWDSAIRPEFANVSELMHFAKTVLETFDFLHRNKIVHLDCLPQNIGMNAVMASSETSRRTGLRDPKEVRYALFDFGGSVSFPEDTVIEQARMSRRDLNFDLHGVPSESVSYPYNPFRMDIAFMGTCLQTYHLENKIPELEPFFDSLVNVNHPNQLSASQALARFAKIFDDLAPQVACAPLDAFIWEDGMSSDAKLMLKINWHFSSRSSSEKICYRIYTITILRELETSHMPT
ncbi:hypothetical protein JR316_0003103 [Psilocybe cubensis]|uniref:Uncharacterized protein n=1 Tax=Psilocybe cubensis TaxID=181762 RepID=A0ACB8H6L8_PSICU|nr:hypothetical protein JR316_0003103 [Psilocybe cubensis]KAH9483633.1 hypothetical protein JR316_0003103 [Psilocybe cubensis]